MLVTLSGLWAASALSVNSVNSCGHRLRHCVTNNRRKKERLNERDRNKKREGREKERKKNKQTNRGTNIKKKTTINDNVFVAIEITQALNWVPAIKILSVQGSNWSPFPSSEYPHLIHLSSPPGMKEDSKKRNSVRKAVWCS